MSMTDLTVDRLSLHLEGVSRGDAQQLAGLIAEGLAHAEISPRAGFPSLGLKVSRPPGTSMRELSKQIVDDLVGQLNRTL